MKFFLLINVKMPTIVGILTFMCRKNSILGLSKPEKAEVLNIFILFGLSFVHLFIPIQCMHVTHTNVQEELL